MKKVLVISIIMLVIVSTSFAQVEKGDSEMLFNATYLTLTGVDYDMSMGSIMFNYGYYLSDKFKIGLGPTINITTVEGETETDFSASAAFTYNFSVASKTIPYAHAQWYQMDFDPEYGDFIDYSYVNIGFGVKNFFNEYVALDTGISYGFAMSSETEGGVLMVLSGFSVVF